MPMRLAERLCALLVRHHFAERGLLQTVKWRDVRSSGRPAPRVRCLLPSDADGVVRRIGSRDLPVGSSADSADIVWSMTLRL